MQELHTFIFNELPVRGALVRLTDAWQEVLQRRCRNHDLEGYQRPVVGMLGEMTAAAVLMRGSIKFDGVLILQIHGDGPISMAVVEVDAQLRLRATATLTQPVADHVSLPELINAGGQGRCAITLDPRGRDPGRKAWQGVVPLAGASGAPLTSVADMIALYMHQSEQLDTTLMLAADEQAACGLMLQRLPGQTHDEDAFARLSMLARSLSERELLQLDASAILHRLFWNEPLQRLVVVHPSFHCSCSRERVAAMLQGLGQDEVTSILQERDVVEVGCEFCGKQQRFDRVDVARLFASPQPPVTDHQTVQ